VRTPTILLVDDEPAILRALQIALEASGYSTRSVMTGEQAVARVAQEPVDMVILDLGLPDIDGVEVIDRIRAFAPRLPIVILSAHGDDASKVNALDHGADDYVSKPFSMPELTARLRTALRHAGYSASAEATRIERGDVSIDLLAREVRVGSQPVSLTRTQFDLLVALARHPNRVLTHRAIASEVWGDPDAAEVDTIRAHVSQLRRKLEAAKHGRRIVTDPGVGYRFVPHHED
jgi:two-component system KDP operon response regulator KdpE